MGIIESLSIKGAMALTGTMSFLTDTPTDVVEETSSVAQDIVDFFAKTEVKAAAWVLGSSVVLALAGAFILKPILRKYRK